MKQVIFFIIFVSLLFKTYGSDCSNPTGEELEKCVTNCFSPSEETMILKQLQIQMDQLTKDVAVLSQTQTGALSYFELSFTRLAVLFN